MIYVFLTFFFVVLGLLLYLVATMDEAAFQYTLKALLVYDAVVLVIVVAVYKAYFKPK